MAQGDDGKKGKKKKSADLIELPIDAELPGNTDTDLQRYREEEVSFFHPRQIAGERVYTYDILTCKRNN